MRDFSIFDGRARFKPSAAELDTLSLASPFARAIFDRHTEQASAFIGRFGLDTFMIDIASHDATDPQAQTVFDDLVRQFVGQNDDADISAITDAQVTRGLRQLRSLLMLRWIWQDALGRVSLETLTYELSAFADSCLCFCRDYMYASLCARYGRPMVKVDGKTVADEFAIIAMGKLGAMELNLSSDIDLIFLHTGIGETVGGKKSIDTQKFMTQLGRGVIRLMSEVDEHGFVFRVDMRLRPWGDGSPLVMTLPALQKYFSQHGRTWERFAWLKARLVNLVSDEFYHAIRHIRHTFVHRYYVDYTAFSALREMKQLIISQQTQRQDLDNVKLGIGGIRDIEFIVQAFALIYGGHHAAIGENRSCLDCLAVLIELGYIQPDEGGQLEQAYRFLRRLEHAIQARHDEQTQRLPSDPTELAQIAMTLGFGNVGAFRHCLDNHRKNVTIPFGRMVTERQSFSQDSLSADEIDAQLSERLSAQSLTLLDDFKNSRLVTALDDEPKKRLDDAYPTLMQALISHANQSPETVDVAVPRLITLLEAIVRRSIYLVMIAENPNATVALIPMLAQSSWIARELALHPMLLDNFLQKRYLHLPDKDELSDILRQSLLRVEPFDDEAYLGAIRVFKKSQVLAVATADILGLRHIMKVSDSLTFIAEVVLQSALQRAFDELSAKHGVPRLATGAWADSIDTGFAIIGYGKLGGLEMSYASDLDVVFIHHIDEKADTNGAKPVSGMKFASRVVQKVLGYLTTQTRDGRAYEMDMRLRPSGNAGVMVISLSAFELYQTQKAWAWEHQALVRARGVAGSLTVRAAFDTIRHQVLTQPRDVAQVRQDVLQMRQKMQTHLGTHGTHEFHLKQDFGGLIDIEFLAQFMVLSHAHQYDALATWSDNVRIFEAVAQTGLWTHERCTALTDAYLNLRKKTHELALSELGSVVDDDVWQDIRTHVTGVWADVMGVSGDGAGQS